jgi:hypothetical protein
LLKKYVLGTSLWRLAPASLAKVPGVPGAPRGAYASYEPPTGVCGRGCMS